ncbi:VCBS repeat domain-containing M23 family metallopeptidase [Cyanobium sp. NIES-981]|uniref:VCBS repeat domain-containing M23 family metallopeptidase n=1 Tax=Cyanobium sp. NIES-981 TaxID=1851505 RepID=UPI0012F9619E|nr:VCBS repeat domain-containing M23 family metallopeptidase [Cyanobium sp. NIES-981]
MIAYDLVASGDTTITSATDGVVLFAGLNGSETSGYGYTVVIRHSTGVDIYGHLLKNTFRVATGQSVSAGQALGLMGSSGNSTAAHLHFERRQGSVSVRQTSQLNNTWTISGGTSARIDFTDDLSIGTFKGETWTSTNSGSNWNVDPVLFSPVADISKVNGVSGQSEVIFRPGNGDVRAFLANSSGLAFLYHKIGSTGTEQKLIGSGNISGSTQSNDELIFRTPQSEIYGFRLGEDGVATQWYRVGGVGSDQQVQGIGDITGDGKDEIIFRSRGSIGAFHTDMNGVATTFRNVGSVGMDRQVIGVGDITGDGKDEIIFGGLDGNIGAFNTSSSGVALNYFSVGWADPSMRVIGPADINGDNRDEIIFRANNGDVGAFRINSSGVAVQYYKVGWADPTHKLIGFGNVNVNSPGEEILFRSPNGDLNAFFMNSSGVASSWNKLGWADPGVPTM